MSAARLDPVTTAVIAGGLDSIAVEMGHKLARMSYSSIIRESEDFGCALCDAGANQLCESVQSPSLICHGTGDDPVLTEGKCREKHQHREQ